LRQVECTLSDEGYRLEIAGVGVFWIAPDGSSFRGTETDPGVPADILSHTIVGPPLVLALALQGAFCLHASAVTNRSRGVAFLGCSGAGKSTLARQLESQPGLGWRRLADDALAAEASADQPFALPHFPQLKLGEGEQPRLDHPERLHLTAIYLLERPIAEPAGAAGVELQRLSSRDAVLALMRHTVAARLFGSVLVERHLDFCVRAVEQISVYRLSYPWRPEAMPDISRAVLTSATSGNCEGVNGYVPRRCMGIDTTLT